MLRANDYPKGITGLSQRTIRAALRLARNDVRYAWACGCNGSAAPVLAARREYESGRDLLDYVANLWQPQGTPTTISKYDYSNDRLGRRTAIAHSGAAFGSAFTQNLAYNDRGELTSSTRTDSTVLTQTYAYDAIGNRSGSTERETPVIPSTYFSNALNQYYRLETDIPSAFVGQGYRYASLKRGRVDGSSCWRGLRDRAS